MTTSPENVSDIMEMSQSCGVGDSNFQSGSVPVPRSSKSWSGNHPQRFIQERENDWEVHELLASPIPVFPKPLALAYRNFHNNYLKFKVNDGERLEVASSLVGDLLRVCFPLAQFLRCRLPYGIDPLISTVKVTGTLYWIVTVKDEQELSDKCKAEHSQSDLSTSLAECLSPTVVLVAIVNDNHFREHAEREVPTVLRLSDRVVSKNGSIMFHGQLARSGYVIILGGRQNPARPSLEFYSFNAQGNDKQALTPWFGEATASGPAFDSNIFSFESGEAVNVERMLTSIARRTHEGTAVTPCVTTARFKDTVTSTLPPGTIFQRIALTTLESNTHLRTDAREYVANLRMRKDGHIIDGHTGHLLGRIKEEEAKRLAQDLGVTIAPPKCYTK